MAEPTNTPDPVDSATRRTRILDAAATILAIGGLIGAIALGGKASGYEDPDPMPGLIFGALLWVVAAVLAGASAISKTITEGRPPS